MWYQKTPGPVFYLLSWSPSHLENDQVTWRKILSSLQVTWKPSHLAKSQVTLVADLEISWTTLALSFVFCSFLNSYKYYYVVCFTIYVQKAVRIIFIDKLRRDATGSDSIVGYLLVRGLLWCCIQWRHYRVDTWRHNNVDADAWRRQQCIARKTIGCVPI